MPNPANAMPFSKLMGVRVTEVDELAVRGELPVREDLCTTGGILHGGAIMAFADALGAVGAFRALPDGAGGTTTIESKTNFLRAAPVGTVVTGEAVALKVGARLSVWQTTIRDDTGETVAVVTQSQLVL